MFSNLLYNIFALFTFRPFVFCTLKGFSISVKKKKGVLFTSKHKEPASANFYYEVAITNHGTNPEYPVTDGKKVKKYAYTIGLDKGSSGMIGGVHFISKGMRYKLFRFTEGFFDASQPYMGRSTVDHHYAEICAYHGNFFSLKWLKSSSGGQTRKSDEPKLRSMVCNPIMCM